MKVIGIVIILSGFILALFSTSNIFKNPTESEILNFSVNRDLTELKKNNLLPKEWSDIKEIKIHPRTPSTENWIKSFKPEIITKKNGHFRLEILIIDGTNKDDSENPYPTVLTQYDIIDIKSQNKIWELTRTFTIKPNLD